MNKVERFGNTKIVCTIGPASQSVAVIEKLVLAGMDVARLNFSHGDHEGHLKTIGNIREASRRTGESITILQDLGGPKIRTGDVKGGEVHLKEGASFTFTTKPGVGSSAGVSTTYKDLARDVNPRDAILVDDGRLKLTVVSKTDSEVKCTVVDGGVLRNKKGMNLPGVKLSVPSLTDKDIEDLAFGLANDIDYVALSFVRSADDIRALREHIMKEGTKGKRIPIVAKIEKPEAVDALDDIVREADVLMVARGDLGVELPPEDVPSVQKLIVRKCNEAGVPVIIATQMLESMVENPRPTRAETSDVANAVLDGADAVMLSAETSVGKYPVEAVRTMDRIIQKSESQGSLSLTGPSQQYGKSGDVFDAIARAACVLAGQLGAKAVVPLTHSGATASRVSKYRPPVPILAVTGRERILRRINLLWGVRGLMIPDFEENSDTAFTKIKNELVKRGYVEKGDYIVFTAGIPLMMKGTTNAIKVERIEEA